MYEDVIERIKKHEGFREMVYSDSLGNLTIGYGFLVSSLKLDKLMSDIILRQIVSKDVREIREKFPWFLEMPEPVQGVIIEMVYQLGINGFEKFKNTIYFLKKRKWTLAAENMKNSKWHKQTPGRCEELASILESNNGF